MAKKRKGQKIPATLTVPQSDKKPRGEHRGSNFKWRIKHADITHDEWGWCNISITVLVTDIICKLQELEGSTFAQLFDRQLHHHTLDNILPDASSRVKWLFSQKQLQEDQLEEGLFSIRVGSVPRIWGYINGPYYYIIWWDPNHTVYPLEKK